MSETFPGDERDAEYEEIIFERFVETLEKAIASNVVGSVNAERLLERMNNEPNLHDEIPQDIEAGLITAVEMGLETPIAPVLRTTSDFSPGIDVMFRQPELQSKFLERIATPTNGHALIIHKPGLKMASFASPTYPGLFPKDDYLFLKNSKLGRSKISYAKFMLDLSLYLGTEDEAKLIPHLKRHFSVSIK